MNTNDFHNLAATTSGEDRTRDMLEQASIDHPFCDACGAPTIPVATGDEIWLDCTAAHEPKTILRRIFSFEPLIGHTHRLLIEDLTERLAA